ncbi:hypothetical protein MMC29_005080, partial [Sticta canariensis]|nr:hypothetical protein [Sticta canariensis]
MRKPSSRCPGTCKKQIAKISFSCSHPKQKQIGKVQLQRTQPNFVETFQNGPEKISTLAYDPADIVIYQTAELKDSLQKPLTPKQA